VSDLLGSLQFFHSEFRDSDELDETGFLKLFHGSDCFFDGSVRVLAMTVVQVDIGDSQTLQ